MKNWKLYFCFNIFLTITFSQLYCDDSLYTPNEIFAFSPKAGVILNYYNAHFTNFQGATDCGIFHKGSGLGPVFSLGFEIPVFEKACLSLGFGYADRGGKFILDSTAPVRDDINSGGVTWVTTENHLDVQMKYVEIFPELRIEILPNLINGPLRLIAGANFSFPFSNSFSQKENIISPANAVYKTLNTRERNISDGNIATLNPFNYGMNIGLENMMKMGKNLFFTQEITFTYNFSNVVTDANWKLYSFKFELGVRYVMPQKPKPPKPPPMPYFPEPDTTLPPNIVLQQEDTFKVLPSLEMKITEVKGRILTGNELLATLPLVNAVFFKRNSDAIPSKYILENGTMPSLFYGDAIDIHRYVLPRITNIINKNDKAKIILKGATSGKDNEPEGIELAKSRAESVNNAFIRLGIPEEKIKTENSIFPDILSNQDYDEGKTENQRVDIIVQNAPLQEYVAFQKFAEFHGKVKINVNFQNYLQGQKILLKPSFYDTTITCQNGKTYVIPVKQHLELDTKELEFSAKAYVGKDTVQNTKVVYTKDYLKELIDLNLSNFEAVLMFDYDRSNLSNDNKGLLKQLCEQLPEGTTIIIYGSTDALGTEQRNVVLQSQRAKVTEQFIHSATKKNFNIVTDIKTKKFPEQTEEGRFLNRSITIRLK